MKGKCGSDTFLSDRLHIFAVAMTKRLYTLIFFKKSSAPDRQVMEIYVATDRHYDKEPVHLDLSDKNLINSNKIPAGWDSKIYHIGTVPSPMNNEAFDQFLSDLDAFASLEIE